MSNIELQGFFFFKIQGPKNARFQWRSAIKRGEAHTDCPHATEGMSFFWRCPEIKHPLSGVRLINSVNSFKVATNDLERSSVLLQLYYITVAILAQGNTSG